MVEQLNLFMESNRVEVEEKKKEAPQAPKHEPDFLERQPDKKEKKLTPRQWELYRLIYRNSIELHRKTTQREICDLIPEYQWSESENTSDHCSTIWNDVCANNLSLEHDKLIITEKYEYWIGSEKETTEFIEGLWKKLSPRLIRYWFYLKKTKHDGQGKLLSNQGEVIDTNSVAREFIESFNPFNIKEGN